MKSVEYQNDEACLTFEENITELNKAVHSLITKTPVPGCELKHSKQLKSHLLFDWEIRDFLKTWRTLGAVDEQNIEGVHPQFNQLVRRFGNTRGRLRQQLVMDEFLFSHSTWMVQTVDDMLRKTKRNVVRGDAEDAEESEDDESVPLGAVEPVQPSGVGGGGNGEDGGVGVDGGAGGEGANPAVVQPGQHDDTKEAEDGLFPDTVALSAVETRINSNTAFRGFKKVDTKISACQICKRRLLQFAAPIHCHEVHKEHAGEETN